MMDPEFWSWLWPRALGVLALLFVLWLGYRIDRARFDACLRAVGDAGYCTMQHPMGAHR